MLHNRQPVISPQDPGNQELRIYRVFEGIEDATLDVAETGHQVKGSARVSGNAAIRANMGAVITNKAAELSRDPMKDQLAIEDGSAGSSAKAKPKRLPRPPKVLTDQEKMQKEFDHGMKKILT